MFRPMHMMRVGAGMMGAELDAVTHDDIRALAVIEALPPGFGPSLPTAVRDRPFAEYAERRWLPTRETYAREELVNIGRWVELHTTNGLARTAEHIRHADDLSLAQPARELRRSREANKGLVRW